MLYTGRKLAGGSIKKHFINRLFSKHKIEKRINEEITINLRTKDASQGGLLFVSLPTVQTSRSLVLRRLKSTLFQVHVLSFIPLVKALNKTSFSGMLSKFLRQHLGSRSLYFSYIFKYMYKHVHSFKDTTST